jgi:hypothetical protein
MPYKGQVRDSKSEVVMPKAAVYAEHAMGCEAAANPSAVSRVRGERILKQ